MRNNHYQDVGIGIRELASAFASLAQILSLLVYTVFA